VAANPAVQWSVSEAERRRARVWASGPATCADHPPVLEGPAESPSRDTRTEETEPEATHGGRCSLDRPTLPLAGHLAASAGEPGYSIGTLAIFKELEYV
jgi:hypothetical protein